MRAEDRGLRSRDQSDIAVRMFAVWRLSTALPEPEGSIKRLHIHRTLEHLQVDLNGNTASAGILQSPLTDSNRRPPPYHFRAVLAGTAGALAVTFCLHIEPSSRVCRACACPRVPKLMYPPRTRAVLSVSQTDNRPRLRHPRTDSMAERKRSATVAGARAVHGIARPRAVDGARTRGRCPDPPLRCAASSPASASTCPTGFRQRQPSPSARRTS
jgi:hypothetical protein